MHADCFRVFRVIRGYVSVCSGIVAGALSSGGLGRRFFEYAEYVADRCTEPPFALRTRASEFWNFEKSGGSAVGDERQRKLAPAEGLKVKP